MSTTEHDLDALFSEASRQTDTPSDDLMARIVADASLQQPRPVVRQATPLRANGWFANLCDWFGGVGSLAGMSAAALAGLYIGVAQPSFVSGLTSYVAGEASVESLDLLPATGTLWTEN